MDTQAPRRRYELDWLRVLAVLAIFVFHCTRFFDTGDWSIKNPATYRWVDGWNLFATSWGMPLILIVSGASIFYTLGKVGVGTYLKGLAARLLLPLLVGMFTHIALQVYLERLQKGEFSGSFFEFYPHYFDGMYAFGGNFAWFGMHLWYLESLVIFSLLLLPLFWWLRKGARGQRLLNGLGDLLAQPGAPYLFALPAILLILVLDPQTLGIRNFGGWSIFIYPVFLIAGFVIASHEGLQARMRGMRRRALGAGVVLSALLHYLVFRPGITPAQALVSAPVEILLCLSGWSWLLAVFGFAFRHLDRNTPFLKYANEAVLPFYILHQTVIVTIGFFAVQWALPDPLKFLFILVSAFVITVGVYEFTVRRSDFLRLLFGMKPRSKAGAVRAVKTEA